MVKKLIVGFLVLLVIWVVSFSVYLGLRFKGSRSAPTATQLDEQAGSGNNQPNGTQQADVQKWASDLVTNNEYKKGSYSGVFPASTKGEVWIIGRKTAPDKIFSGGYFAVKSEEKTYTSKLSPNVIYTYQVGDDNFLSTPNSTSAASIKTGDFVAARTAFVNNFGLTLEVRRLIRPQGK